MTFPTIDLPPHDPDRWQTTDGFDNSEVTNVQRAAVADTYGDIHLQDESDFADCITNLLHLAHSLGHNPNEIQTSAIGNFYAEAGPLPTES